MRGARGRLLISSCEGWGGRWTGWISQQYIGLEHGTLLIISHLKAIAINTKASCCIFLRQTMMTATVGMLLSLEEDKDK